MTTHTPIGAGETKELFAPLARFANILVAVSGGPDSLALLTLLAQWRAGKGRDAPLMTVATVDHGLRADSAREAEGVARYAASLGLVHRTLVWTGDKPHTGIQHAARQARYGLLEVYAAELSVSGATAIATAHTRDDQAETLVMRLSRGAGVDGLSAIPAERPIRLGSSIALVRPLLDIPKSRLIATLQERGIAYVEDPANADQTFERVRVRELLRLLEDTGVSRQALATSARRIGEARAALDFAARQFQAGLSLALNDDIFCQFERAAFEQGPVALRHRVLSNLLDRFGGASKPARLSEIENMLNLLARTPQMRATLGGAVVSAGKRFVRIWRESGRIGAPLLTLTPGSGALWDQRFWVASAAGAQCAVDVRPLGAACGNVLKSWKLSPGHPARSIEALPSFWTAGTLLAVPTLNGRGCLPNGFETPIFSALPARSDGYVSE